MPILDCLLVLLGLAVTAQEDGEPARPAPLAIVGATVIPLDSERRLADHTLLVENGRISALGPRGEVALPADAQVIDGTGRFLMPGLVDMHVHAWAESDLTLFLVHGVTTVRNLFGSPMHLAWREQVASGARVAPTIVTAGPIVDGRPPNWPNSLVVTTPEEARSAVALHVEAGYDFIKVYNRLPADAYAALVEEAALAGLPVDGHVPRAVGLEGVLAAKQRVIEHLTGYGIVVAKPGVVSGTSGLDDNVGWQHIDDANLAKLVESTKAAGTWNCPTFVVFQKWLEPRDFERELGMAHMRYAPPFTIQLWRQMNSGLTTEMRVAGRDSIPGRMRFVKALSDAGGRVLVGTDMGNPLVLAGYSLHEELANFVAAGLTPYRALVAATRSPAECLGQAGEFGTLAVGLRADMLLLHHDPLLDVDNARDPVGVVARGRWLDRADLAGRLAALAPKPSED
jgi:imidazolonepropionase-like amidohydrolase